MRKMLLVAMTFMLLGTFLYLPQSAHAAPVLDKDAIDDYVERYLSRNGLPGVSIVIVKDGETVYARGYGHDSEGSPITEHSLIRIGSASKPITAFAVLQLVDRGAVALDDPVIQYLPELTMDDDRFGQVTIRQLLSHTSGIRILPLCLRRIHWRKESIACSGGSSNPTQGNGMPTAMRIIGSWPCWSRALAA